MPYKLHPLWWTPLLPLLFFASSAFSGLAMAIFVVIVAFRAFRRPLNLRPLSNLARVVAVLLGFYLLLKVGDLALSGEISLVFTSGRLSLLFMAEIVVGALIPLVLYSRRAWRESTAGLVGGAACVLGGLCINRINVALLALAAPAGAAYAPHWMEVMIALAAVAAGILIFAVAAQFLPVLPGGALVRQGGQAGKLPQLRLLLAGAAMLVVTALVVVILQPVVRAESASQQIQPAEAAAPPDVENCRACHYDRDSLLAAGADVEQLAKLYIEPEPLDVAHGQIACVTCHEGNGNPVGDTPLHTSVVADPSAGTARSCLACHSDLRDEIPGDCMRTPHNEVVHGKLTDVTCSDCHGAVGAVGHGFDPKRGEVVCPMGSCIDCHVERQLDSELCDCGTCHITVHQIAELDECGVCHLSTETWQAVATDSHSLTLSGGHDGVGCAACHDASQPAEPSCVDCHEPLAEPHYGPSCEDCHSPDSFQGAQLPAALHPVPLDGAHQQAPCAGCHGEEGKTPSLVCSDCHERPDEHLPGDCELCHSPVGWAESMAFVVDLSPGIPHGVENQADCLLCHALGGEIKPAPSNHRDYTNGQCVLCHKAGL
jgi:hypothetical protein